MKYCSDCGSAITREWVNEEGRERYRCTACGSTHYENPRIIVYCSVLWRDTVLMCRRAQEPGIGLWTIPSGYLEFGETLEEGAARETLEEVGVDLDPASLHLHAVVNMTDIEQVAIGFRVEVAVRPVIKIGPECLEARFVGEAEIAEDQFAWSQFMGNALPRFFEEIRSHDYKVHLLTLASSEGRKFRACEYKIDASSSNYKFPRK